MPPIFSIVIPARDEELWLERCLTAIRNSEAFLKEKHPAIRDLETISETIVVINRCSDHTEEIARHEGCKVIRNDSKNLAQIRNSGAEHAHGQILITIDADSLMSPNMLSEIYQVMTQTNAIGGGVLIVPERWSVGIAITGLCLLPIALWYRISGGLFFCKLEDFKAINGFNEKLCSVEDIDFAIRLRAYGKKLGRPFRNLWKAHIRSSCRKFDRLGDWYFILHPHKFLTLLKGRNQAEANKVWYDFEH